MTATEHFSSPELKEEDLEEVEPEVNFMSAKCAFRTLLRVQRWHLFTVGQHDR